MNACMRAYLSSTIMIPMENSQTCEDVLPWEQGQSDNWGIGPLSYAPFFFLLCSLLSVNKHFFSFLTWLVLNVNPCVETSLAKFGRLCETASIFLILLFYKSSLLSIVCRLAESPSPESLLELQNLRRGWSQTY